jgi:DNA-binding transcriptional LysR family regulator
VMFLWKLTSLLSDAVQRSVSLEIEFGPRASSPSSSSSSFVLSCVSQGCLIAVCPGCYLRWLRDIRRVIRTFVAVHGVFEARVCFFWCGRKAVARRICETFGPWRLAFFGAARS